MQKILALLRSIFSEKKETLLKVWKASARMLHFKSRKYSFFQLHKEEEKEKDKKEEEMVSDIPSKEIHSLRRFGILVLTFKLLSNLGQVIWIYNLWKVCYRSYSLEIHFTVGKDTTFQVEGVFECSLLSFSKKNKDFFFCSAWILILLFSVNTSFFFFFITHCHWSLYLVSVWHQMCRVICKLTKHTN